MVKTGNRIYKISVRKFTTNQISIGFYFVFFHSQTWFHLLRSVLQDHKLFYYFKMYI